MPRMNRSIFVAALATVAIVAIAIPHAFARDAEKAQDRPGIQVEAFGPDGKTVDPWGWKSGVMSMSVVPGRGEFLFIKDVNYGEAHDMMVRKVLAVIHDKDVIKLRCSAEMSANVAIQP